MLKVEKLVVGVMQSNCYILYNTESKAAVVIDAGDCAGTIINKVLEHNLFVEAIILTHGHFDHILAVDALSKRFNAKIIINRNDEILLKNPNFNLSRSFLGYDIIVESDNLHLVDDNNTIKLIGYNFKFISTPGHSAGSMCIAVENFLFTGDTLFKGSIGNEFKPFGDLAVEIESIKTKLLKIDNNYICLTGHGDSTTLNYEKKNNIYIR